MRAVIIGGTVSGLKCALSLRNAGYEVKLYVSSTYLGEDFTGTWKYFPVSMQAEGKRLLSALLPEVDCDIDGILLNGALKKQFLKTMDDHGISVSFMTRVAGVRRNHGKITHVQLADKLGLYEEACDLLIDATCYHALTHFLCGKPVLIKVGSTASVKLEYSGMDQFTEAPEGAEWYLERGAASKDHAYLTVKHVFDKDVSLEETRSLLLHLASEAAQTIALDSRNADAFLLGTASPVIEAEIERPDEKPYENLYFPEEIGETAQRKEAASSVSCREPYVKKIVCDVLVAGAGTAGVRAAIAAKDKNTSVCLAEFFSTLGGTRTTGGVQPPYDGNRNRLFLEMWNEIYEFAGKTCGLKGRKTSSASEALLYEKYMREKGIQLLRPAVAFSVKTEGKLIKSVFFASEDCIYEVQAGIIIDATGDADIAVFAGEKTMCGDEEMGATQNYSQFHISGGTVYDTPMADQDVMNQTDRSEWQRALRQNTERCAPFDMVEMLTVRESRRIEGRDTVTLSDIYRNRRPADAIYDCMSDYDTHSRCFSPIGRYGVLPSHAPIHFVSVPFGALLPKALDNLIVCAKSVSAEQEAAAHMRMSPDIMCIGHISGLIAAQAIRTGKRLSETELSEIQNQMFACGALIRKPSGEETFENTASMIAARLASGDESAFADALLCRWEALPELLKEIQNCKADSNPILISKVLLFYGDTTCAPRLSEELKQLNGKYGVQKRKDSYPGKIIMGGDTSGRDLYWQINSLVMLLAKNGFRESIPEILEVMNNTCRGEYFFSLSNGYHILRPDMHVHGTFDRMLCLACAAILMPDPRFQEPLMRLYRLNVENDQRLPVFSDLWLEMKLAQAAYLSGSREAGAILKEMENSPYFVIRRYVKNILTRKK